MREKTVQMYYCDHCKKKGQRRHVIAQHEARCVRNPLRRCGVCHVQYDEQTIPANIAVLHQAGLEGLREDRDGCPVCMVIAINKALLALADPESGLIIAETAPPWYHEAATFDLKRELAAYWAEQNAYHWQEAGY